MQQIEKELSFSLRLNSLDKTFRHSELEGWLQGPRSVCWGSSDSRYCPVTCQDPHKWVYDKYFLCLDLTIITPDWSMKKWKCKWLSDRRNELCDVKDLIYFIGFIVQYRECSPFNLKFNNLATSNWKQLTLKRKVIGLCL